jgi:hypothetical protein
MTHEYTSPTLALAAQAVAQCMPEARADGIPFEAVNMLHRAIAAIEQADTVIKDAEDE